MKVLSNHMMKPVAAITMVPQTSAQYSALLDVAEAAEPRLHRREAEVVLQDGDGVARRPAGENQRSFTSCRPRAVKAM